MSSNSNNIRQLNVAENSSSLIYTAPANPMDMSDLTYHAQTRDADTGYLIRVKTALKSCISNINFTDPVNIRKAHEELMNQVRNKVIHTSNKYKVQIEPLNFEWDLFLPILEKEFPDILNEMPSHNSQ